MASVDPDAFARRVASEAGTDDPTGWFEHLYTAAENGETAVPWDRGAPHPLLTDWFEHRRTEADPGRALIVGCGPCWDSEYVAGLGYETTAFDVSATAVAAARRRHPATPVTYEVADLLALPPRWNGAFDLVVESMTVQSMPVRVRDAAIAAVNASVAPGGTLFVIASARDEGDPLDGPPWPLSRSDLDRFASGDLRPLSAERLQVPDGVTATRWRAEFRRPAADPHR